MSEAHRRKITVGAALQTVRNVNVNAKGHGHQPRKFKLPNGLTVLLIESHKSPVVSVQMWVRTGSADEKKGEEGISHFIEHLLFKGTDQFAVGEIAAVVEGAGGELNAYTSFDQTVFYVTISKAFVETGLNVISQMMGFPTFDPAEIDNEREVVVEEIKRGRDSLSRQASQLLFSSNFKGHPYAIPVIGYEKVVRKVSSRVLLNYFHGRYTSQNMFLVVAGDFEPAAMKKKISEYFNPIPKHRLRKVRRSKTLKQTQPRIEIEKASFEESQFHLSWKIPGAKHRDIPALDVMALILGQGESSRLSQRLRIQKAIVNHIYASSFTPHDLGLITVSAGLGASQLPEAMTALGEELTRLCSEPPSSEEIRKAVVNIEAEDSYSQETVDGLARKVGSIEHLAGDYKFYARYMKAVRAVKPGDVLKVARKYLDPQLATFSMITSGDPKEGKGLVQKWLKAQKQTFASAKKKKSKNVSVKHAKRAVTKLHKKTHFGREDEIERRVLKNGATLLMRPSFDTSVVSARIAFSGGVRAEPAELLGLTELLARTWTGGTTTRSEADIQHTMDGLAGGLSPFGGRNSFGLSLETLAPFAEQASELFFDVLAHPNWPKDVIEREKQMMREQLKTRADNPAQTASLLFVENMFQNHPYARDPAGTPSSIDALSAEGLKSYMARLRHSANCTVCLAGNIDRDFWAERLEKALAPLERGAKFTQSFAMAPLKESQTIYRPTQKQQTHIIHGYRGLTLTSPERFALQVMQSILAGQGGRLFLELRDKASLAYSVSPLRMEGIEGGYFGAYIGCSPEKGAKAIDMMKIEFEKLASQAVSEEELDRAKRYLIGRHDIELQRTSSIASAILFDDLYGLDHREVFQFAGLISKVTTGDVQSLAQKIFAQNSVTVAVGASSPW